jgi:hypothetical protein
MTSFVVWDMTSKADGIWRTVEASDARHAAEQICGTAIRSFGTDDEIRVRVRSLDRPEQPAVLFYAEKPAALAARSRLDIRPVRKTV